MLRVSREDNVEDPIESQDRIENEYTIVPPDMGKQHLLSEQRPLGRDIPKTHVHDDVPNATVDAVDCGESDEHNQKFPALMKPEKTE